MKPIQKSCFWALCVAVLTAEALLAAAFLHGICLWLIAIAVCEVSAFVLAKCLLPFLENRLSGTVCENTQSDFYNCEDDSEAQKRGTPLPQVQTSESEAAGE